MSERKVLNKYYPPDFDPSKIPRSKVPRSDTFSIRIMAPFNMRCNNCGEYIYKGKKFNSRKETVQDEFYLGLRIFRFYIKCPRCVSEIAFKTDLENTDYALEAGASRNFEATRTAELMAKQELKEKEEEELNDPMKVLEKRTQASRDELDMLETLEDLKDLNSRHAQVDTETMVKKYRIYEEKLKKLQEEEDDNLIKSIFCQSEQGSVKRILDDDDDQFTTEKKKILKAKHPTVLLTEDTESGKTKVKKIASWQRSIGVMSKNKSSLGMLVKRKVPKAASEAVIPSTDESSTAPTMKPRAECATGSISVTNSTNAASINKSLEPVTPLSSSTSDIAESSSKGPVSAATTVSIAPTLGGGALSLLGNYSDSSDSN